MRFHFFLRILPVRVSAALHRVVPGGNTTLEISRASYSSSRPLLHLTRCTGMYVRGDRRRVSLEHTSLMSDSAGSRSLVFQSQSCSVYSMEPIRQVWHVYWMINVSANGGVWPTSVLGREHDVRATSSNTSLVTVLWFLSISLSQFK